MATRPTVVVDTPGFFSGAKKLRTIIDKGDKLSTIDLVVFEFTKVMEDEIDEARAAGKSTRVQMLQHIKDRFPRLLKDLEIELESPTFTFEDLAELYSMISKGFDSGDSMIWLKMQRAGLNTILTDNRSDWKRIGAKVISVG